MSENTIQEFISEEGFKIRQLDLDGNTWFIVADIFKSLGLEKRHFAEIDIDSSDKMLLSYDKFQMSFEKTFNFPPRGMNIVTEAGMYDIIMQARTSAVSRKFQRWVTHIVLPSIRANGGYILGQEKLPDKEKFKLEKALKDVSDQLTEALIEMDRMADTIEELRFICEKPNGEAYELEDGSVITKDEFDDAFKELKEL